MEWDGKIAIQKRPAEGLLAGLYEFPAADGHLDGAQAGAWIDELYKRAGGTAGELRAAEEQAFYASGRKRPSFTIEKIGDAKHVFSHVEWYMAGYHAVLKDAVPGLLFVKREQLKEEYAVPSAYRAYLDYCFLEKDRL